MINLKPSITEERTEWQNEFFIKPLQNVLSKGSSNQKLNILQGTTGSGKTYVSLHKLPSMLIDVGVEIHIILSLYRELIGPEELPATIWPNNIMGLIQGDHISGELLEDYRNNKELIVLPCTHAWFFGGKQKGLRDYLASVPSKISYDCMEIHKASSSTVEWAEETYGNRRSKDQFKGRLFEYIKKEALDRGSWAFGSTATLTAEIKADMERDELVWNVINDPIPLKLVGYDAKFLNYPTTQISPDKGDIAENVRSLIKTREASIRETITFAKGEEDIFTRPIIKKLIKNIAPKIGIYVEDNHENSYTQEHMRNPLNDGLMNEYPDSWEKYSWIEPTCTGWVQLRPSPDGAVEFDRGPQGCSLWLRKMNKDPYVICFVVKQKGTVGINIPSLTGMLNVRSSNAKNSEGIVTLSGLQVMGRCNRPYYGGLTKDELLGLPLKVQNKIIEKMNTFNFNHIGSDYWTEVINEYIESYGLTYDQARKLYAQ